MYAQYPANVCKVLAPVMDYIWRHGAADIQVPYPVGRKPKMEGWQQDSGGTKKRYEMAGHQVGVSQREECQGVFDDYLAKGVLW